MIYPFQQPLRSRARRRRSIRPGVSAVEFSLTAPILFFLVFGLIEMARLYQVNSVCTIAAIAGAREAAVVNSNASRVEEVAGDILNGLGISDHRITIEPGTITSSTPQVSVTVSAPLSSRNGLIFTQFVKGRSVNRTVVRTLQPE